MKFGLVILEVCERTDSQRHARRSNTCDGGGDGDICSVYRSACRSAEKDESQAQGSQSVNNSCYLKSL